MALVQSNYKVLPLGSKAPDFSLFGTDGKNYSLSGFLKSKALLVIFMCNHCPYVQPKMDYFVELQSKYGPKGLQIVAINSNDVENYPGDSPENMKKWATEKHFNFPYLFDETQKIAKSYGAECTPDPFLFDSSLKLVYHGRFDDAHAKPHSMAKTSEMEIAMSQVLSGKPVSVEAIPSMGCSIKWKSNFLRAD